MKKILKKLGNLRDKLDQHFMATAFAEAGCPKYAREQLGKYEPTKNLREKIERTQIAITYAEANKHD